MIFFVTDVSSDFNEVDMFAIFCRRTLNTKFGRTEGLANSNGSDCFNVKFYGHDKIYSSWYSCCLDRTDEFVPVISDRGKCKGKVHPIIGHGGPEGEQMYSSTLPSTSVLDGGWVVNAPAALPPGKSRYPLYRKLDGPQSRYVRVRKISTPSPDSPARS